MKQFFATLICFTLITCTSENHFFESEREVSINEAGKKLIEEMKEIYRFEEVRLVSLKYSLDSTKLLIIDLSYHKNKLGAEKQKVRLTREITEKLYAALPEKEIEKVYKIEVWLTKEIYDRPLLNKGQVETYPFWIQEDGSLKTNCAEFKNT